MLLLACSAGLCQTNQNIRSAAHADCMDRTEAVLQPRLLDHGNTSKSRDLAGYALASLVSKKVEAVRPELTCVQGSQQDLRMSVLRLESEIKVNLSPAQSPRPKTSGTPVSRQ